MKGDDQHRHPETHFTYPEKSPFIYPEKSSFTYPVKSPFTLAPGDRPLGSDTDGISPPWRTP